MKEALLGILAVGLVTTAADAARLSMQFQGGGTIASPDGPSDMVRIEIYWKMGSTDTAKHRMTGLDLRFNVLTDPDPLDASFPTYGDDNPNFPNSSKWTVVAAEVKNPNLTAWTTAATTGVGQTFSESNFFFAAGDPAGFQGIIGNSTNQPAILVMSFTLHKNPGSSSVDDTYITFRHRQIFGAPSTEPLPAAYNGPVNWDFQWQEEVNAGQQFDLGQGNVGDGNPAWDPYHGYETFEPLIIRNIPEPGALVLLVLGGLALLRRSS